MPTTADPRPTDPSSPASPPPPRRRRGRWIAGSLLALVLLLVLAIGGALWWSLYTSAGSRWLLGLAPGVTVVEPRGALLGGDFDARRIEWASGDGLRVELDGLAWRGLALQYRPYESAWVGVRLDSLAVERVVVHPAPATEPSPAPEAPQSLRLPLELRIGSLRIGSLYADGPAGVPIRELQASVHVGAESGAQHRVEGLRLAREPVTASGSLRIGSDAPLNTELAAELASAEAAAFAWQARVAVRGPLQRLQADATLQARGMSADAKATLLPFAPWPLPAVDASTRALDLSALLPGAPATALDARVHLETEGLAAPARADVEATNTAPGRIDEGRLPLRRIELTATARPDQPTRIDASSLKIGFGDGEAAAGTFEGSVGLDGQRLDVQGRIAGLQPDRLDARAAPMTLNGPLSARVDDLGGTNRFDVKATLDGVVPQPGTGAKPTRHDVQLQLEAAGVPADIELKRVAARARDARAELSGRIRRPDEQTIEAALKATLQRFDPRPFWVGPAGSPLRRASYRIDANADVDLRVRPPQQASIDAWLAALDGKAAVELADSVVAGVATSGRVAIDAGGGRVQAQLALDAAGNRAAVEGLASSAGRGANDRWRIEIDAPKLQNLAPLAQLAGALPAPAAGADAPALAGAFDADARITGRWPRIASDGRADLRGIRYAGVALERADARWEVGGTSLQAPIDVQVELADASFGGGAADAPPQRIGAATLRVDGTLASHRFALRASSPVRPPAWVDELAAVPTGDATLATLNGSAVVRDGRWQATFDELRLGGTTGRDAADAARNPGAAPALEPWFDARDLKLAVELDPASGQPAGVDMEPGRASALGAQLRWQRIAWRASRPGLPPQIDVSAALEPMAVAPWLARLQPNFGWGGDLAVGARIEVRSRPAFSADVVVERTRGDLSVTDPVLADASPERARQSLGLTDLRLALAANDGVWHFTQALAGRVVGVAAGAISLRVSPTTVVPPPDTPIEGVIEAQVADLGVWSTWAPAGWRIGGVLRTSASIGGTLAAPEYTGRVTGRELAVRNALEGVNVRNGEIEVALQGPTARIERFVVRSGDGRLDLDGNASFGAAPQAQLQLRADRFEVLGRVDRRVVASGQASMRLDADSVQLSGNLKVDEGLIDVSQADAPSLGDDVVVHRPGAPPPEPEGDGAPARQVRLELRVDLGEELRLRGRGIDTRLEGDLLITAPKGQLAVNGTVRTADGKYAAYGQKLDIERGLISFNGPVDQPRLDILAIRPKLDVKVGVAVTGTPTSPRVRLTSEPDMSDNDKLSWLILGRAPDGLGRTQAALLQRAALGALSGEGPGASDRLIGAIGLDELSVSQTEGATTDTVVTLGKQIGERWYVAYERGLNAAAGSWQLIYRVARRFTLRGQSGLDNSIDAIWTWRWD